MKKPKITINKTWHSAQVGLNNVKLELELNYDTKSYNLTHGSNDTSVTFKSEDDGTIEDHLDRAKCVIAALEYIKQELEL